MTTLLLSTKIKFLDPHMNTERKNIVISYLLLLIAIVLWASAFVGIRIGLKNYTPGVLALLRFLVASTAIIPLHFRYRNPTTLTIKNRCSLFFLGFLGIGIYHSALNYGEVTISAGLASFIIGLSPIFTALLALFFLKEKLRYIGWIGIAISLVGVVLITISQGGAASFNIGVLAVLASAIVSAIYSVWQKTLLKKINVVEMTSFTFWAGTLCLLIFLPQLPKEFMHASIKSTLAAVYLGIFPSVIAYISWCMALKRLTVTKASSALYAMPILSTFLGWIILNEKIALLAFIGGCIALIGAFIVQSKKSSAPQNTAILSSKASIYTART